MVAIELCYKILTGKELYDFLVDYNNDDPWGKFEDLKSRIQYFVSNNVVTHYKDSEHYFFCAFDDDKIVGMLKLKTGGNESYCCSKRGYKNWICSLSVDIEYRGQGIASALSDMMFKFAKDKGFNILTSGYTKDGFEKLKPIFARDSEKYGVDFLDERTKPEF